MPAPLRHLLGRCRLASARPLAWLALGLPGLAGAGVRVVPPGGAAQFPAASGGEVGRWPEVASGAPWIGGAPGLAMLGLLAALALLAWGWSLRRRLIALTARLRAEASARAEGERRFRAIFEEAPVGMFRSTPEGQLLSANPQLARLLDYPSPRLMVEEVNRAGLAAALYEDPAERQRLVSAVTAPGAGQAVAQVRYRGRDGRQVDALVSMAAVDDPLDGRRTLLGFVQDVGERLREEATRAQRERLQALGQMAGGVAHDLNNLLSVMLIEAQMLVADHPELAGSTGRIQQAARTARTLTDGLLGFLRRRAADPAGRYDLHEALEAALGLFSRVGGRHVHLVEALLAHTAEVQGVRADLQGALLNLLLNARDAMPDGGVLTVRTRNTSPGDGAGGPRPAGIELVVSDTGTGMTPEVLATCGQPFFTTKGDAGTGLGLWTARAAVERQGGTLRIASSPGVGTAVTIELPLARD